MDEQQQAALDAFMQFYDRQEALGNFEEKIVGEIGYAKGVKTTKSSSMAFEAIRTILVFRGEDELVAWLDEMRISLTHWSVQASILYTALTKR